MDSKRVKMVLAAVILVGYIVFVVYMASAANDPNDLKWTRLVYIFGSAEAIVFGTVGWIFGREINRERAEKAEERATKASSDASKADAAAEVAVQSGYTLAREIRQPGSVVEEDELLAGDGQGGIPSHLRVLANALFPEDRDPRRLT